VLRGVLALLMLVGALTAGPLVLLQVAGVRAEARVVDKQERFELNEGGWRTHILEIAYRYRPSGAATDMTVADVVDAGTFARLHKDDTVSIRYSPIALLRHTRRYGSTIEGTSAWAGFFPPTDDVATADLLLMVLTIALAAIAYKTSQPVIVGAAAAAVTTMCSAVVLLGPFALAMLFGAWRATRRAAFGWGLLAALVLTPELLWARIPHPPAPPAASVRRAAGYVREARTVAAVWPGYRSSGQWLPQPFDVADVVFTPAGATHALHVVDRIDSGSVVLRRDGAVIVVYPADAPERGRLMEGTRTYDRRLFNYLIEISYGWAALLALVVAPAWSLAMKWWRGLPVVRRVADARRQLSALAKLPDDAGREAIVSRLRERGIRVPDAALKPGSDDDQRGGPP
jgi:hypothetical protein